jgi:CubicO group peptidase (beta-lactamase class C family)
MRFFAIVMSLSLVAVSGCTSSADGTGSQGPSNPRRPAPSSAPVERELAGYMRAQTHEYGFAGAVLVARGADTLLRGGYGLADIDSGNLVYADSSFPIASVTKSFTASALVLLAARGKLALEDSVCMYIIDCPASWNPVTLADLLRHTSGIPQLPADQLAGQPMSAVIAALKRRPLSFDPGSDYTYSNSNYMIAGFVIQRVSGTPWTEFLERNIFLPYGMTDTGIDRLATREVQGHTFTKSVRGTLEPVSTSFSRRAGHATIRDDPAGGLSSTVDDLRAFADALDSGRLLSHEWLERMWTTTGPARFADYALGWESIKQLGTSVIQHGGGMPGFSTCLSLYPDIDLYVIVLSNVQEMVACEYIGRDLAAIVLGQPHHRPNSPDEDVEVSAATLKQLAGTYAPKRTLGSEGGTDSTITLTARAGSLLMEGLSFVAPPYVQKTRLEPISGRVFFNPQDPHVRISFRHSPDGTQLVVHRPPYKRLPAMTEIFLRND